ncbi:MAG: RDD family protein [Thermobacillus sp.]|jgi:uncharacterized RDD family membrane protein YckC|uniref:Putative membrane protein/domain protein n=1 Tax=Thermobacillus composti (strain DSM 18247 / JCM 13945 / KWC4) TaxID=717605 RepID=L0EJB2_THECK|nr:MULTISPECIES: RDD family protein [Thermobacillus]AGA59275.1 putative membrane protein/domain protein [Thermobacillus composti KWC4]REK52900.1 MAG: RDD family protein [Thermobacillus sp.]
MLKRLVAYFIDHTLVCLMFGPVLALWLILNPDVNFETAQSVMYLAMIPAIALLLLRDCLNGRSPGKRLLKLRVVDADRGTMPEQRRLILRNVTLLILPVDLLVFLISRGRRIGDFLSGTQVVDA